MIYAKVVGKSVFLQRKVVKKNAAIYAKVVGKSVKYHIKVVEKNAEKKDRRHAVAVEKYRWT